MEAEERRKQAELAARRPVVTCRYGAGPPPVFVLKNAGPNDFRTVELTLDFGRSATHRRTVLAFHSSTSRHGTDSVTIHDLPAGETRECQLLRTAEPADGTAHVDAVFTDFEGQSWNVRFKCQIPAASST